METLERLEEIVRAVEDARFVVLTIPLAWVTKRMVRTDKFTRKRGDAYLVNVAGSSSIGTRS